MRTFLSFAVVLTFLALGCHSQSGIQKDSVSDKKEINLIVLSDLVTHADEDGKLVRFVGLDSPNIERLKTICHNQFQIVSADSSDSTGGFLHLKGTNKAGVLLTVDVKWINGKDAEALGSYLHVGTFATFVYRLRYDGRAWRIISCEFGSAS